MNRHKGFQKLLNCFLSLVLIVTSISVPGVAVSAEDEIAGFSDVIVSEDDEGEGSDYPDYSDVIAYNLTYNEDNSKATLTISVDTEDDVSLDFSNNDELSEKMGGESPSCSINYDISTEDGKTYAFDIVKNGDYNFQAIVLPEGEDFDGQTVGSKDISIQVTDLVEGEVESPEYEAQETKPVKDWTFDITQKNVQLAYYNWQAANPPTSEVTLNTITQVTDKDNKTSQTIKDYIDPNNSSGGNGYVVVFVKPNENYLFTGLGAEGEGQCFAVKETFNASDYLVNDKGIGNYPGLQYVVAAAYKAGYKAAFGWSRDYNAEGSTLSFETIAKQPSATISVAAPDNTSNVKPGDTLDFTVTIEPESEKNSTVDQVLLTSINGVTLSEPITCEKNDSGNYIATVPYTITQADFESGEVKLTVSGSVQYNCSFGMSAGSVESACTIVTTTSATAAPGPNFAEKATATHQFESATTEMPLPQVVTDLCPGEKVILVNETYTPADLTTTRVDVEGGYWSFEGWKPSSVTPTQEGENVTVTGKWKLVKSISIEAPSDVMYNGTSQEQKPVVKDASGKVLTEGTDYTLTYSEDTTNKGTVKVQVIGKNGYDSGETSYKITKRPIKFVGKSDTKTYDGTEQTVKGYTVSTDKGQYGLVNGHKATLTASATGTDVNKYDGTISKNTEVIIKDEKNEDVTDNYQITTTPGTLTIIAKDIGDNTISVDGLSDVPYNGKDQKQEPTVTDGETKLVKDQDYSISYSSTPTGDYKNAGAIITVTITGKGNYSGTTNTIEKTYKIIPATLTVETPSASKVYDGTPLQASGSITGFVPGETATLTTTGSQTNVGNSKNNYKIEWENATAKASNYTVNANIGTLEVEAQHLAPEGDSDQKYIGITVNDPENKVYDGQEHKFSPEVTGSGGKKLTPGTDYDVTYTREDEKTTDDFTNCGKIVVTITGKNNYSGSIVKTYNITQRSIIFKGNSDTKTYDGTEQKVEGYTVSEAEGQYELADGDKAELTASASGTNAGTHPGTITPAAEVKITNGKGENVTANYEITTSAGSLKITEKAFSDETISVNDPANVVYDGNAHQFIPKVTTKDGKLLASGTDYEATYTTKDGTVINDFKNCKEINVIITGKGNYSESVTKTYSITPATLMVTTKSKSKVYDGEPLTADGELKGLVKNEKATLTTTGSRTNVGASDNTYKISWETADQNNYNVTTKSIGKLTVTQRPITFKGNSATKTYNGEQQTVEGYTVSTDKGQYELVKGDTATLTASATGTDVNKYAGIISKDTEVKIKNEKNEDVTGNYQITTTPGTLTITAKNIGDSTLSVDGLSDVPYNGKDQKQEPSVTDGSTTLVKDKDYSISYSSTPTDDYKNAGTSITVTITGMGNYSKTTSRTYTITPAPLTVTTYPAKKVYNGEPLIAGGELKGLVNGETATLTTTGSQTEVGESDNSYELKWGGTANKNNYEVKKESIGKLIVTKSTETIVIKTSDETHTYDGKAHKSSVTVSGLPKDYKAEYTANTEVTDVTGEDGLKSEITDVKILNTRNEDVTKDYTVETVEGTIRITPATLKVQTGSATKVYDGKELTAKGSITGFQNNENAPFEVVGSQTDVGNSKNNYKINWKNGTAKEGNYKIQADIGTLTVEAQHLTPEVDPGKPSTEDPNYKGITTNDPKDLVYDGDAHRFIPKVTTKAGTELKLGTDYDVTYTREEESTDDFTNCGKIVVTITGKGNYSGKIVKTYSITPRSITFVGNSDTKTYNGEKQTVTGYTVSKDKDQYELVNGHKATLSASASGTKAGKHGGTISDPSQVKITNGVLDVTSNYSITTKAGTLTIKAKDLEDKDISVDDFSNVIYNGTEQKQEPTVTDGTTTLEKDKDYTVSYSSSKTDDYTNAGTTITVTITGKGNYTGNAQKTYCITPATLTVKTESAGKVYDGKPLTAAGSITGFVKEEEAPFEVIGSQTDVGSSKNTYTIDWDHATAKKGNYSIQEEIGVLNVEAQHLAPEDDPKDPSGTDPNYKDITINNPEDLVYDGNAHKFLPEVVTKDGTKLTPGTDYDVSYTDEDGKDVEDFTNAGDNITVTITGKGNYSGTVEKTYKIKKAALTIKMESAKKVYDGKKLTADGSITGFVGEEAATLTVTGSQTKVGESDNTYNLDWNGTAKASNYTITVEKGTLTVEAQHITPTVDAEDPDKKDPNYSGVTTNDPEDVVYDGDEHKFVPEVTTKNGTKLIPGVDYEIIYPTDDFTNPGEKKVIIIGKGNYAGTIEKTYKILEKEETDPETGNTDTDNTTNKNDSDTKSADNTKQASATKTESKTAASTTSASNTGSQNTSTPVRTGDTSNLILWLSLLILAIVTVGVTISIKRKR